MSVSRTRPDGSAHDAPTLVTDNPARSCANCGQPVVTAYCGGCGQSAHIHRSLAAIGHDALHGVLHVEGRVWRTLALLAARPGDLTRRYIDGQRARFVGPFALFLFALFAAYVVLTSVGTDAPGDPLDAQERAMLVDYRANLGRVDQALAALTARGQADPRALDADDRETLATLRAKRALLHDLAADLGARDQDAPSAAAAKQASGAPPAVTRAARDDDDERAQVLSWYWMDDLAVASDTPLFARIGAKLRTNPGLFAYKMQTTAYKYAWALIPLSLPLMALMFIRRRLPLYDHYVFVGYSMAWMLAMTALSGIIGLLPGDASALAFVPMVAMPWHLYRQLRGAYALGRFGAAWRTLVIGFGALCLVVIFALALVGAGALG